MKKRLKVFHFKVQINLTLMGAGETAQEAKDMARENFISYLEAGEFRDFDDYVVDIIPTNELIETDEDNEPNE